MDIVGVPNLYILQKVIRIVFTLGIGLIFIKISNKSVKLFFDRATRQSDHAIHKSRLQTLQTILITTIDAFIFVIIVLVIASDLGFNITPLLTGAGILGVAISLGAQTVVKDIIMGFLLIMDNHINVGDKVKIDKTTGTVIRLLLRKIVIQDSSGNIIYIPNSEVSTIIVSPRS